MEKGITIAVALIMGLSLLGFVISMLSNIFIGPATSTPTALLPEIMKIMKITANTKITDLGSGTGNIVIYAARNYSAKGIGIELSPALIAYSKFKRLIAGVSKRFADFRCENAMSFDPSEQHVIYCYLNTTALDHMIPVFKKMSPNTTLYVYGDTFSNIKADRVHELENGNKLYEYSTVFFAD